MTRLNQVKTPDSYKRSYFRFNSKSSSQIEQDSTVINLEKDSNIREIQIRLVFIRIGEIDTLNERYQAEVYYEAKWKEKLNLNILNLSSKERSQLINENVTVRLRNPNESMWAPGLFIENTIGQPNDENWITIKKNLDDGLETLSPPIVNLLMCEHHRVKGFFWEKLELNHFPADVQDLTISITTHHNIETCSLIRDKTVQSSINREAFFDQQEWKLYEHVGTETRLTQEEYSFQHQNIDNGQNQYPVIDITCRAARRPGYYYWNGFCLIFLITICSFCIFSIPPDLPQNRLQITCTLLLTSVTFRWVVNKSLPTISYLTTLDQYAIISIIILVALCVWHSVIAAIIFLNPEQVLSKAVGPTNYYVKLDRYVFICMFIIYIILHISLIIWLIFVPYKRRRQMEYFDQQYAEKKHIRTIITTKPRFSSVQLQPEDLVFRRGSITPGNLSMVKSPMRPMKKSDNLTVVADGSTFIPIKEESNNDIEFQEHDDVFYDHTNITPNEPKPIAEKSLENP